MRVKFRIVRRGYDKKKKKNCSYRVRGGGLKGLSSFSQFFGSSGANDKSADIVFLQNTSQSVNYIICCGTLRVESLYYKIVANWVIPSDRLIGDHYFYQ